MRDWHMDDTAIEKRRCVLTLTLPLPLPAPV